jgi:hypothetical protein
MRLLVYYGASPAAQNFMGRAPLHLATEQGSARVCRCLLQLGADLNATDHDGWSARQLAEFLGHAEVGKVFVEALCERGNGVGAVVPTSLPPPNYRNSMFKVVFVAFFICKSGMISCSVLSQLVRKRKDHGVYRDVVMHSVVSSFACSQRSPRFLHPFICLAWAFTTECIHIYILGRHGGAGQGQSARAARRLQTRNLRSKRRHDARVRAGTNVV